MYYVQFHHVDLGVYCLPDTSIVPISSNEYFYQVASDSAEEIPALAGLEQL